MLKDRCLLKEKQKTVDLSLFGTNLVRYGIACRYLVPFVFLIYIVVEY
jgi:hypothetical protein